MLLRSGCWTTTFAATALATLASADPAPAQVYPATCGSYNHARTYVSYQPGSYAPVYSDRPVVYTAPVYRTYPRYGRVPVVRNIAYHVSPGVRTTAVYVHPRSYYRPRTVRFTSGYGYGGRHYHGYSRAHIGSHFRPYFFRRHGHHRTRGFHLNVGALHFGTRRGHHRGFSLWLGR